MELEKDIGYFNPVKIHSFREIFKLPDFSTVIYVILITTSIDKRFLNETRLRIYIYKFRNKEREQGFTFASGLMKNEFHAGGIAGKSSSIVIFLRKEVR